MPLESPEQLRALCQSGKEADPGWYFIHRRLSIYVTWVLLHTAVTPNQVTGLMMLAGMAGAALLVPHSAAANIAAFAVLYLAFLLDKVDGEIARYRHVSSVQGLLLDRLHHLVVEPLIFLAAAWHDWSQSRLLGAWMAAWVIVAVGNLVDEHQHLSAYIMFKHMKGTLKRPDAHRHEAGGGLRLMLRAMRPLKGFRMFIVAVPALGLAYALEAWSGWPAIRAYLYASAAGLGVMLAFQAYYYFAFKLEDEIGEQAAYLAPDAPAIAPTEPACEADEADEAPARAASQA